MKPEWPQSRSQLVRRGQWLLLAALLTVSGFIAFSLRLEGAGFPLDDAWIHQTYARSLAQGQGWSFQPGQPSGGSTSPLWTLLLVPGHWLEVPPVLWSAALGVACLVAIGSLVGLWVEVRLLGLLGQNAWLLGLLVPLEWHLVWAALSGMEILVAGFFVIVFHLLLDRRGDRSMLLGVIVGLSIWARPDLASLAVAGGWYWAFGPSRGTDRWRWAGKFALGILLLFLPYLGFQWATAGSPWPSTFYAKQQEYAALRQAPFLFRYLEQFVAPLAGPLSILLPGLIAWLLPVLRHRRWVELAPLVWLLSYVGAFALRLPVTYQHGRYAMPIIPVLIALSVIGAVRWLAELDQPQLGFVIHRAWPAAVLVGGAIFWALGAQAYARDVAIIETEMVRTSRWIADNTAPTDLIAAHDIGALGYYGQRPILDLAGLISPEVVPILRDEKALADLLDRRDADYLMTFPDWYPGLVAGRDPTFQTAGRYSPEAGGSNMAVYPWP